MRERRLREGKEWKNEKSIAVAPPSTLFQKKKETKEKSFSLLLFLRFFSLCPTPSMSFLAQALGSRPSTGDIEFWHGAERSGWLMKQGEVVCLRGQSMLSLSFDA